MIPHSYFLSSINYSWMQQILQIEQTIDINRQKEHRIRELLLENFRYNIVSF